MRPRHPRPIAICVFRDNDRIFVAEGYDSWKKETFYHPLGGAISFGKHSRECIVREIREEIGAEVKDLAYVGTIETIFTCDAGPGHEIVVVYEGKFIDPSLYGVESLRSREETDDEEFAGEFVAVWKSLDEFRERKAILYPEGLLDLLSNTGTHRSVG